MEQETILWRRLDRPGHEAARLYFKDGSWRLEGAAVFAQDALPCCLDYQVLCGSRWQTISARVSGWVGSKEIEVEISADPSQGWYLNGLLVPQAAGCLDLDLNFSPSTNLLPIRRLNLQIGQSAPVKAAWLRFPEFTLEPLEQVYRRVGAAAYRYESAGGAFTADLTVNAAGFVTLYPDLWEA